MKQYDLGTLQRGPRTHCTHLLHVPSDSSCNARATTSASVDGVTGVPFILWAGVFILDPPGDTNLGNHFALVPPFFRVLTGKVGTPIGPFTVPNLGGIPITLQAGVFQGGKGELSNFVHKKL